MDVDWRAVLVRLIVAQESLAAAAVGLDVARDRFSGLLVALVDGDDHSPEVQPLEGHLDERRGALARIPSAPETFAEPRPERRRLCVPVDADTRHARDLAGTGFVLGRSDHVCRTLAGLALVGHGLDEFPGLTGRLVGAPGEIFGHLVDVWSAGVDVFVQVERVDGLGRQRFQCQAFGFDTFGEQVGHNRSGAAQRKSTCHGVGTSHAARGGPGNFKPAGSRTGCMVDVLANKRAAMRFRVLVEIAERQPAVSQGEIAEAVGVTSQAVSEYIRELVEDGLVEKEGRSRYRVTTEGVDWTLGAATDVRRFADHVTEDVLGSVQEDAAIATAPIDEGQTVTLSMREGLQHATPVNEGEGGSRSGDEYEGGSEGSATGVATTDADTGGVVGVTGFEGVIDLEPGEVHVLQVPSIRSGLPDEADLDDVREACEAADVVAAAGVEAVGALCAVGIDSVGHFAAGEVAADAASRGLDAVVVASVDNVGRVTDALRDAGAAYEVS